MSRVLLVLAFASLALLPAEDSAPAVAGQAVAGAAIAADARDEAGAKAAIARQMELLREGKTAELRACFTERLRERITPDLVAAGAREIAGMTLESLAAKAVLDPASGPLTARLTMANERTLTTLVWQDGRWLADTIWFR